MPDASNNGNGNGNGKDNGNGNGNGKDNGNGNDNAGDDGNAQSKDRVTDEADDDAEATAADVHAKPVAPAPPPVAPAAPPQVAPAAPVESTASVSAGSAAPSPAASAPPPTVPASTPHPAPVAKPPSRSAPVAAGRRAHRTVTPRRAAPMRHLLAARSASVRPPVAVAPAPRIGLAPPVARRPHRPGVVAPHRALRRVPAANDARPPLIRTFTRILAVVPGPLRIAIALLAALALALAARSMLATLRARRLERQRLELLDDVGLLQGALLPLVPERVGSIRTSAAYRPADGPAAGGDFYDIFSLADGRIGIIIGDLSGHGRRALPHTALVRFTLRAYLEAGLTPRHAIQRAAPVLERQLGDSFATVAVAVYERARRRLTYASAGHPAPIISGLHTVVPANICCAPPIGFGMATGTRQTTVYVPGEALICFYTDGLVEARCQGELLGTDRLAGTLGDLVAHPSAAGLLARIGSLVDERPDDMAACLLAVDGGQAGDGGPSGPRVELEEMELWEMDLAEPRIEELLAGCGVAPAEIAAVKGQALAYLRRGRAVVIEVRPGAADAIVAVRPGERTLVHRPARIPDYSGSSSSAQTS